MVQSVIIVLIITVTLTHSNRGNEDCTFGNVSLHTLCRFAYFFSFNNRYC